MSFGDKLFKALLVGLAKVFITVMLLICAAAVLSFVAVRMVKAADLCERYQSTMVREAQAVYGINAPAPMFMGQIRQESSCREGVTAWDGGMGLAQFMPATVKDVTRLFQELGAADPYSPTWAMRALVRYDGWIYRRVKGKDECHRWAAALTSYNAGLGWVQRAQKASSQPDVWFGVTEKINAGQSQKNFEYSRLYPHWIIEKHQKMFLRLGRPVCSGQVPPVSSVLDVLNEAFANAKFCSECGASAIVLANVGGLFGGEL